MQSDARGALVGKAGKWWEVEPTEQKRGLDISAMTLEWVNHSEDAIFSVYTRDGSDLLRAILPWSRGRMPYKFRHPSP